MDYALINKEVLPFICTGKKVSIDYLYNCTKIQKTKIEKFLDVTDTTLPTILQAKKLAKCLRIPFVGLYMNTEDINIKSIPRIKNYRTSALSLSLPAPSISSSTPKYRWLSP